MIETAFFFYFVAFVIHFFFFCLVASKDVNPDERFSYNVQLRDQIKKIKIIQYGLA